MSQTVDTNVLLHASNASSELQGRAIHLIQQLAAGPSLVTLLWPTLLGYLRIATHPNVFARPLSHSEARTNVAQLMAPRHVRTVGESDDFWARFEVVADDVKPRGNHVPDAHLVALMLEHGVTTIWTHDRDFRRYRGIKVRDPFTD